MNECQFCTKQREEGRNFCCKCGTNLKIDDSQQQKNEPIKVENNSNNGQSNNENINFSEALNDLKKDKESSFSKEVKTKKRHSFFVSKDEYEVASLGDSYLKSAISSFKIKKSYACISNKRFYFEGTNFYLSNQSIERRYEEIAVNIKDISSANFFTYRNPLVMLCVFVEWFVVGIFSIASVVSGDYSYTLIPLLLLCITLFYYFNKPKQFFKVTYPGGSFTFDTKWYSDIEMRNFQKAIHKIQDYENQ